MKYLFKDEVRQVGEALGLPHSMVWRQPFLGPGLGVRCIGAITRDRLAAVRESDAILREEFAKSGMDAKVWQYFTIVPDIRTTGVVDGKRTELWPVIIRAVNTTDAMTASVPVLTGSFETVTRRVQAEVPRRQPRPHDLSPKPPPRPLSGNGLHRFKKKPVNTGLFKPLKPPRGNDLATEFHYSLRKRAI